MPKARQQRPPLVIGLSLALALVLVWQAGIAARNGMGDLYAEPAIDYLETKTFEADSFSTADWQAIEDSLVQANTLMPRNPRVLESLGWLQQLRLTLFAEALSIEEMDAHANAAKDYYREAVGSRPTWPYYWGNLALEHYRRGEYTSPEYSQALANASLFGPWKNDAQRLVTDLGSETWDFLSPRAQREVFLTIDRSLHRQPQATIEIVRNHGAWAKLCAASNADPGPTLAYIQEFCARELSTINIK